MKGIVLALCFLAGKSLAQPTLTWCVDHLPDRHVFIGQEVVGPTVDFMQRLAQEASFTLKFSPNISFSECLEAVKSGKYELIVAVNYSESRAKYMHMIPLYRGLPERLFYRTDNKKDLLPLTLSKVQDGRLGLPEGYVFNSADVDKLGKRNKTIEITDVEDGLALLYYGHIDYLLAPAISTQTMLLKNARLSPVISSIELTLEPEHQPMVNLATCKNCKIENGFLQHLTDTVKRLRDTNSILPLMYPGVNFDSHAAATSDITSK